MSKMDMQVPGEVDVLDSDQHPSARKKKGSLCTVSTEAMMEAVTPNTESGELENTGTAGESGELKDTSKGTSKLSSRSTMAATVATMRQASKGLSPEELKEEEAVIQSLESYAVDGRIPTHAVAKVVREARNEARQKAQVAQTAEVQKRWLFRIGGALGISLLLNFGLTLLSVFLVKDNYIKEGGRMVDRNDQMVLVGSAETRKCGDALCLRPAEGESSQETAQAPVKTGAVTTSIDISSLYLQTGKALAKLREVVIPVLVDMSALAADSPFKRGDGIVMVEHIVRVGIVKRIQDGILDIRSADGTARLLVRFGIAKYLDNDLCQEPCDVADTGPGRRLTDEAPTAATFEGQEALEPIRSVGEVCHDAAVNATIRSLDNMTRPWVEDICTTFSDQAIDEAIACVDDDDISNSSSITFTAKEILQPQGTSIDTAVGKVQERCLGSEALSDQGRRLLTANYGWCSMNVLGNAISGDSADYCKDGRCRSKRGCNSKLSNNCCIAHDKCLRDYGGSDNCPAKNCKGKTCDWNLAVCAARTDCSYRWKCWGWKWWGRCKGWDLRCWWNRKLIMATMPLKAAVSSHNSGGDNKDGCCKMGAGKNC